ncbi:MAG: hypothetical protein AAF658_05105 [Myxococcota bacterium]
MPRMMFVCALVIGCSTQAPTSANATGPELSGDSPAAVATRQSSGKEYSIAVQLAATQVKSGDPTAVTITITPQAPWVLKTTTPMKIQLECTDGCDITKARLSAKDIDDAEASAKSVKTQLKASSGKHRLDGDLSFFLCTDEICKRQTDDLTLSFDAI